MIFKTYLVAGSVLLLSLLINPAFAYYPDSDDVLLESIYPTYPSIDYGSGDQATLIKKGEYLTKAGDCIACHTNSPENGKPFAGGLPIITPFGTFYSTNITPEKETGLGNWSEEDFIRAMRHGKNPKGKNYFPVFPYTYFNNMSTDDLRAMWTYLQHIPAVHQANRKHGAPFPLSWRFAQYGWKLLFFYPYKGEYEYDNNHSKEWNRGAYLVEGLGHCAMCHTPLNLFGAPKRKYNLTGAFIDGYWAPNITGYGLEGIDHIEVADIFVSGRLLNDAGPIKGPMAEVNHNSLQYLSKDDRLAIATYLKETTPKKQPHAIQPSEQEPNLKRGRQVYRNSCVICHQNGIAGAPRIGNAAAWDLRIQDGLPELYRHTINGYNNMPIRGACVTCSDNDVKAAVDYLIYQSLPRAKWQQLQSGEIVEKPDLADGKEIYQENCAVCHDAGKLGAAKLDDKDMWEVILQKNMDILILNTINGLNNMPKKGGCTHCTTAEIIAAVKYMVQTADPEADYSLW